MNKLVEKDFLGKTFKYKTQVNEDGQVLWTKEIDNQFALWLYELKESNRELFKIQYSVSDNAYQVLRLLKEELGVFDESLLVRAITITFINFIDTRKGYQIIKKLKQYKDSHDFKKLNEGELIKKNLYFSPIGMRDVESYSQLTKQKKGQAVKNALYSVLLIYINEDEEIRRFWEQEILEKISTIVKAA